MSLKTLYNQVDSQEKAAEAFADEVKAALGAVSEAAAREDLAKTASATGAEEVVSRHEDKAGTPILEKAKEQIARGIEEKGRVKAMTGDELKVGDNPVEGAEELGKAAAEDERWAIAGYAALVEHVKVAASRSHYLTKVACPVCAGYKCLVCDNLGSMTKAAADQVESIKDHLGTLIAADQLYKGAEMVQESMGRDSVEYQTTQAKMDQAQALTDASFETMLAQEAPEGWPRPGSSTEEVNPVLNQLGLNRVHKIK